jgi:ferredoxin
VVIPLDKLGEYTEGIERINIEFSIANKLQLCARLAELFSGELPVYADAKVDRDVLYADRPQQALELVDRVAHRWAFVLKNLDTLANDVRTDLEGLGMDSAAIGKDRGESVFARVQLHNMRISWKKELLEPLRAIFAGRDFEPMMKAIEAAHAGILRGRVFVALHMHAGDGNVHTNIPVNSDDYEMLRQANEAVARIMKFARALGGVISGEHGIGITKIEYLTPEELAPFAEYKKRVDPEGHFNRGKLLEGADLRNAYTPSFALIGHESLILEQSDIGAIANSFKDCLRCGKCKPVCSTHVPRANLLYSPRNKILATSLLTEAFLYEEQTRRGVSIRHFDEYGDVADHCTVCHKCESPCPVDIDFGDVSIAMRNLLAKLRKRRFNPGTWAALQFLTAQDATKIKVIKAGMIDFGFRAQRLANKLWGRTPFVQRQTRMPPETVGPAKLKAQVIHFINKPMPGGLPKKTSRALLDVEDPAMVPIIRTRRASPRMPRRSSISRGAGASVSSARWGSPRRRCSTTWAANACSRRATCVAATRRPRRGAPTRARRSRCRTACSSTAWPPRSTTSTSRPWWCRAAPAWTSCRNTNSTRSSPAAGCSTSTSTCWRRA